MTTKTPLELPGASLPFWQYRTGGRTLIEFDSTGCRCPIPLANAMAGLERIAASGETLVMINGFEPKGLYERVRSHFRWQVEPLDDGRVRVRFTAVEGRAQALDFGDRHCHG